MAWLPLRDSGEPGACVRPGLGAKHGPVVGRQGWQQHAAAIVEVASPRRVELPAVQPISKACFCMWRRQKAARDVVPVGAVSPTFGDQKPSGCVRMGEALGIVVPSRPWRLPTAPELRMPLNACALRRLTNQGG